jgi:hypothetical protein
MAKVTAKGRLGRDASPYPRREEMLFAQVAPQQSTQTLRIQHPDARSVDLDEAEFAQLGEGARERLAHGAQLGGQRALGAREGDGVRRGGRRGFRRQLLQQPVGEACPSW